MQESIEKVKAIIAKYSEQLAICGIKITASKRYFETEVGERIGNIGNAAIFNEIDRTIDRKEEKKKGFHHQRNRYHCMVVAVAPIQQDIVGRNDCREYAFLLKKVERAHIGMEPKETTYEEQKLLSKVENRIAKILRKAQKANPRQVCQNTLYDAFRYTAPRYAYKRRFLNKDRADWELIFLVLFGVLALVVALMIWLIGKWI